MIEPGLIIPDASVVLAYILGEESYQVELGALFQRYYDGKIQFLSPSLIIHELSNRLGRIPDFPIQSIRETFNIITTIEPTSEVIMNTFGLIKKYSQAVWYDALYHATALTYDGVLITADSHYYEITKNEGNIQFIADYS